ncbi:MAG: HipA N-terminal domain-containing protein [Clostridia bacterium]|nr:HipA N-terminal domain-containing protein [Clostridia bacterium]
MENRVAYVYICDIFAGVLSEIDSGYMFAYDSNYLKLDNKKPVSLTLPLQEAPYISSTLFSFFDGLIPEGWMLDVVIKNWKLDRNDRFGALLKCCVDCVGNVSIRGIKA